MHELPAGRRRTARTGAQIHERDVSLARMLMIALIADARGVTYATALRNTAPYGFERMSAEVPPWLVDAARQLRTVWNNPRPSKPRLVE